MTILVMRSQLFLATKLIPFGLDLACVFRVPATLCECGSVTVTRAEIYEGIVEEQPSTSTLRNETRMRTAFT